MGKIKNSVNYPECRLAPSSDFRLVIMNQNVPNMVGQISTVLAKENINIAEMLNRSKGDYACTIIDVADEPSEKALDAIRKIKGVVKVRLLELKK